MPGGARRLAGPAVAALLALSALGASRHAPPEYRVAIFSGQALVHRIAISDSDDVAILLDAVREPMTDRTRDLSYRPYLDVALFAANPMSVAVPLAKVPLDRADAHARFYPAYGDEAPFWVVGAGGSEANPVRYVLQRGLDVLQRRGVPIRLRPGG
jgi:hypothetical protein